MGMPAGQVSSHSRQATHLAVMCMARTRWYMGGIGMGSQAVGTQVSSSSAQTLQKHCGQVLRQP